MPFKGFAVYYWIYSLDRPRWVWSARKAFWMKGKGQVTECFSEVRDGKISASRVKQTWG